jgi:Tfp pilus assembly protein PilO
VQVKTKNVIVSALGVLLVGMLWFQFVYSPMESKASKARSAAHDADVSADNLRKAITGANSGAKKDKPADISAAQLTAAIPVDAAEAAFLRSIDDLRISSGADWQSITPAPPVSASSVATISVGITVQGTEDQLARYMSGLSDMKRIFVLDNVSISPSAGGSAPGSQQQFKAGAAFVGDNHIQMQLAGRIFGQASAVAAPNGTVSGGTGTTPATGAPAPTGPSGTQNG